MSARIRAVAKRARYYRDLARTPGRTRVVLLTLYYLAIVAGLVLVRITPDEKAVAFVYQAF